MKALLAGLVVIGLLVGVGALMASHGPLIGLGALAFLLLGGTVVFLTAEWWLPMFGRKVDPIDALLNSTVKNVPRVILRNREHNGPVDDVLDYLGVDRDRRRKENRRNRR